LERNFKIVLLAENAQAALDFTHPTGSLVAFKRAVVDLHIAFENTNGPTLKVACPAPGIGAKKVQEISETRFRTTYRFSAIALERAGVDLDICLISTNISSLEVACPPPEIRKVEIVLFTECARMEWKSSANES
jgi:hypothetical protein